MSVKPVTYYEADCDECGTSLAEIDDEGFSAMATEEDTRRVWVEIHNGLIVEGHWYCESCAMDAGYDMDKIRRERESEADR